jgi:hypothetical protein
VSAADVPAELKGLLPSHMPVMNRKPEVGAHLDEVRQLAIRAQKYPLRISDRHNLRKPSLQAQFIAQPVKCIDDGPKVWIDTLRRCRVSLDFCMKLFCAEANVVLESAAASVP